MVFCHHCLNEFDDVETRNVGNCNHSFCCECLVKYLGSIDNPKVKCMIPQCDGVIPDNIIRECLTDDQIKAYEILSASSVSRNIIKCFIESCPFYYIGDDITMFACRYCRAPNCIKCKRIHRINGCGRHTTDDITIEARARHTLKKKRRQALDTLNKKIALIPNPISFRCPSCDIFILPRTGVILRNCLHCFCVDCLKLAISSRCFISHRMCSYDGCYRKLDDAELCALDPEGHVDKLEREASSRFYQCKTMECTGMWDATEHKGTYKCPKCSKINCLACQDIHEGMTCEEFRNTKSYTRIQKVHSDIIHNQRVVVCYICTRTLIQKGGCGEIYCDNCGSHTCIFTGKISGSHDPDRCYCKGAPNCTKQGQYCGCTARTPCDKLCLYGCVQDYLQC